jgi:hypothetical protein
MVIRNQVAEDETQCLACGCAALCEQLRSAEHRRVCIMLHVITLQFNDLLFVEPGLTIRLLSGLQCISDTHSEVLSAFTMNSDAVQSGRFRGDSEDSTASIFRFMEDKE